MKKSKVLVLPNDKTSDIIVSSGILFSGKISRRVIITPYRNHSKVKKAFNKKTPIVTSMFHKPKTNKIKFPNESTKIIFLYWNRLGHPFVQHRNVWNKTTAKSVERISSAIKKDSKESVLINIDRLRDLFLADWFKYRIYFGKFKISLPDFFRYNQNTLRIIRKRIPECPASWYKECLKGMPWLKAKYSAVIKDRNPTISKLLINSWKAYDPGSISTSTRNNLVRCARIATRFAKVNSLDVLTIVEVIDKMLNEWKVWKPQHAGWLKSAIFWNEQFPKELVRYGVVKSRDEMKEVI